MANVSCWLLQIITDYYWWLLSVIDYYGLCTYHCWLLLIAVVYYWLLQIVSDCSALLFIFTYDLHNIALPFAARGIERHGISKEGMKTCMFSEWACIGWHAAFRTWCNILLRRLCVRKRGTCVRRARPPAPIPHRTLFFTGKLFSLLKVVQGSRACRVHKWCI